MKNRTSSSRVAAARPSGCILLTSLMVSLTAGCTHVAKTQTRLDARLQEHSRALTTAIVDTLHLQPAEQRNAYSEAALQFSREDQRIEGLPLDPVPVSDLLGLATAGVSAEKIGRQQKLAAAELASRFTEIEQLLARERRARERLVQFGQRFEQERNEQRTRWWKRGSILLVALGAIVALVVFCPAALPILGRMLAWGVGRFPALAGMAGVVSVKAFDAVVKAIERTKPAAGEGDRFGNQSAPRSLLDALHANLSREMDSAHKILVRKRKSALRIAP